MSLSFRYFNFVNGLLLFLGHNIGPPVVSCIPQEALLVISICFLQKTFHSLLKNRSQRQRINYSREDNAGHHAVSSGCTQTYNTHLDVFFKDHCLGICDEKPRFHQSLYMAGYPIFTADTQELITSFVKVIP